MHFILNFPWIYIIGDILFTEDLVVTLRTPQWPEPVARAGAAAAATAAEHLR